MTSEIKRLKEEAKGGNNSEMKVKIKKLNEEVKEKNKKLEEGEKRVQDLMKKFGEETNTRAKAEAEVIRANKMIDYLHEILEKSRGSQGNISSSSVLEITREKQQPKQRCLDQDRPGGCQYGLWTMYGTFPVWTIG